VPAKKDPSPGKLELRLLFFSSLIFISFGKTLESRFRHKHKSRLQSSGEAVNFVSNTGSKLLVWQRQIDENLKGPHRGFKSSSSNAAIRQFNSTSNAFLKIILASRMNVPITLSLKGEFSQHVR